MSKQNSLLGLLIAAVLCMAVLIMPVTTYADSSGGLTLTAAPSVTTASLGETISYNYVITSTCNATINSLVLTDDKFGTISLPATSLAPGENISVSMAYVVVAADFPGPIATTSSVTGISTDNTTFSSSAATSVALNPQASSIKVTMSADKRTASENESISYTYTIINTGQVELSKIVLTDSRLGTIVLSSDKLSPQAKLTASGKYTVLASDFPGPLVSSATVKADNPSRQQVIDASKPVSVMLTANNFPFTKARIHKLKGVPGKGIDHAPGLQKPFNMHYKGHGKGDNQNQGHQNNEKGKDK